MKKLKIGLRVAIAAAALFGAVGAAPVAASATTAPAAAGVTPAYSFPNCHTAVIITPQYHSNCYRAGYSKYVRHWIVSGVWVANGRVAYIQVNGNKRVYKFTPGTHKSFGGALTAIKIV